MQIAGRTSRRKVYIECACVCVEREGRVAGAERERERAVQSSEREGERLRHTKEPTLRYPEIHARKD
jgi:hypothetical protein